MKSNSIFKIALFFSIFLSAGTTSFSQNDEAAFAAADTSHFSVNSMGGWRLYNSYLNKIESDSIQIELIVSHTNNMAWDQKQYVGLIKDKWMRPSITQILPFKLLYNEYELHVEETGKCYIRFVGGALPTADPIVLPLKVFYKL